MKRSLNLAFLVPHVALVEFLALLFILSIFVMMIVQFGRDAANASTLLLDSVLARVAFRSLIVSVTTGLFVACLSYVFAFVCHVYCPRYARAVFWAVLLSFLGNYYASLQGWFAVLGEAGLLQRAWGFGWLSGVIDSPLILIILAMTVRYLAIGVMIVYFRLRALPVEQVLVARNLGLSTWSVHRRLFMPWARGTLAMVCFFTIILASLDTQVTSVVGRGNIQLLGDVIREWYTNINGRPAAFGLGVAYLAAVAITIVAMSLLLAAELRHSLFGGWLPPRSGIDAGPDYVVLRSILLITLFIVVIPNAGLGYLALGGPSAFPSEAGLVAFLEEMRGGGDLRRRILETLRVATLTAVAATILALISAFAAHVRDQRLGSRARFAYGLLQAITVMPLLVPPLLLGMAAGTFQGQVLSLRGSWLSIVVCHTIIFSPLAYFVTLAAVGSIPRKGYLVASNLGVGPFAYFSSVFLRVVAPALCVAAVLVFSLSMNESIVSVYVGGFDETGAIWVEKQKMAELRAEHFVFVAGLLLMTAASTALLLLIGRRIEVGDVSS